jgi:hypothetical protein
VYVCVTQMLLFSWKELVAVSVYSLYVCMYVCIYIYIYIYICTCEYVCDTAVALHSGKLMAVNVYVFMCMSV